MGIQCLFIGNRKKHGRWYWTKKPWWFHVVFEWTKSHGNSHGDFKHGFDRVLDRGLWLRKMIPWDFFDITYHLDWMFLMEINFPIIKCYDSWMSGSNVLFQKSLIDLCENGTCFFFTCFFGLITFPLKGFFFGFKSKIGNNGENIYNMYNSYLEGPKLQ